MFVISLSPQKLLITHLQSFSCLRWNKALWKKAVLLFVLDVEVDQRIAF